MFGVRVLARSNGYWSPRWARPTIAPMIAIAMPIGIEKKEPTNAIVEAVISQFKSMPKRKHPPAGALAAHWQLGINSESANPIPNIRGQENAITRAVTVILRTTRRPTAIQTQKRLGYC